MAEPTTKICEACDAEIATSEEKCPKCGVTFSELDETVTAVEKAQAIIEKRRKAKEPKPCTKCGKVHDGECAKKTNRLRSLGAILKGKK